MSATTFDVELEKLEAKAAAIRAKQAQAATKAEEARRGRRHAWAAGVIDRFTDDLTDAERAVEQARTHFNVAVVGATFETVIAAYLAWHTRAVELTVTVQRIRRACDITGNHALATSLPNLSGYTEVPAFSFALQYALDHEVPAIRAAVQDELTAELATVDAE